MALMALLLSWVIRAGLLVVLYLIGWVFYNIFFHPLAKFPGPLLWRTTWLPYTRGGLGGHFPYDVQKLHQSYGDVVRTGPDELSFAHLDAWDDIYSNTAGANSGAFRKSQLWHGQSQAGPPSVFATIDLKDHARIRRFMDPAFSERAFLKQEPILHEYVDLCIERLRERLSTNGTTTVNVVDWLNFVLFDTIGDLSFGESFGCLEKCEPAGWMAQMGQAIKLHYTYINLRHYPVMLTILGPLLMFLMPKTLLQAQEEFRRRSVDKLNRRLASQSGRPDIVSQLLQSEDSKEGLTPEEVVLNSMLFINAASETTGTSLAGAINLLLQNPESLSSLEREVRQFPDPSALTLSALKRLPYLNAVIKESLRMCNPNPIGHIRITPATGGTVAGCYVPPNVSLSQTNPRAWLRSLTKEKCEIKKTLVTVHPHTISYSEKYFHEPASWRPERWLDRAETDAASPYFHDRRKAVRAFGWGPQNCVGEPLGWAEMRLVLAKLVRAFDLRRADTAHSSVVWEAQEVYGVLFKHRLDVTFAERVA